MLKTKMMGALALTALMGLGAIGPVNAFAEARALNAPATNFASDRCSSKSGQQWWSVM